MTIAHAVVMGALFAPQLASETLGAFVAAKDGWAVSAETAVTTGTHVPRHAPCGTASKILVTPTNLAMLAHVAEGPVRQVAQTRLEEYVTPPTPDDLRELQREAWRVPLIFARRHEDDDVVLAALEIKQRMTQSEVWGLFSGNRQQADIDAIRSRLEAAEKILVHQAAAGGKGGRPVITWTLVQRPSDVG